MSGTAATGRPHGSTKPDTEGADGPDSSLTARFAPPHDDRHEGVLRARVARFAWAALAYTIAVILFGAVVRITGSGAGCGQHWPTCQGEVVHLPRTLAATIELTHRLTSGLSLVAVVTLVVMAFRRYAAGHAARAAAVYALVFMIVEALVGAVLVKLAGTDGAARAGVTALHLANTSLLTGAMTVAAWSATRPVLARELAPRGRAWWPVVALGAVMLLSMTGAVTALGDTLYPVGSSGAGTHLLERTRIFHPIIAIAVSTLVLFVASQSFQASARTAGARDWARAVALFVLCEIVVGILNVGLSAPGWMQVVHLLVATLLWLSLVLLAVNTAVTQDRAAD